MSNIKMYVHYLNYDSNNVENDEIIVIFEY